MAEEITYSVQVRAVKANIEVERKYLNKLVTMAGDAYSAQVQSIPTTASGTAIVVAAAVGTEGYAVFINQDDINFVQIGAEDSGTFYPVIKLLAGQAALFPLAISPYAVADTAAVLLESFILEA